MVSVTSCGYGRAAARKRKAGFPLDRMTGKGWRSATPADAAYAYGPLSEPLSALLADFGRAGTADFRIPGSARGIPGSSP
ncbi:hypothetical protein SCA03_32760 [Streptomyces cacaoi]|uniref:Uncharacterized protein n=1 Tax=Streptomyces cacaoi TaxID=1898 RepID=A0A4Y3QZ86_STRCI|nr:hypothetical protein SCA03_32760 [Streptomyces cacaoi]